MKIFTASMFFGVFMVFSIVSTAWSGVMVDQWKYTNTASWVNYYNNQNNKDTMLVTDNTLSWGNIYYGTNGGSQSSITLNTPAQGTDLYTNTSIVNAVSITHNNWTLAANSPTLKYGNVLATIAFEAIDPVGPSFGPYFSNIEFNFFETVNYYSNGDFKNSDLFIFIDPEATKGSFSHDGFTYTYNFFTDPENENFTVYDTDNDDFFSNYLDGLGYDGIYYGFTTLEAKSTEVPFYLNITATPNPVPEPSTVLLLGAGLLGLGAVARRRRAN